jgi:UDP-sugar transporter A1/2/3
MLFGSHRADERVLRDSAQIGRGRFFQGYDIVVAIIVVLQATGGLVVAIVMRHAGNILKCFAVSISMCNCAVFTFLVSSEQTNVSTLVIGLALVVVTTFAYSA